MVDKQSPAVLRALVIEDDEHIIRLLEFILRREGYQVQTLRDGRSAAEAIGSAMAVPDVVTIDVMLPYTDGYQLLAAIRAQPAWKEVPVLMLTAKSQERDIVRALEAGANDYLVKPFMPDELRARVRRLRKP
jgi:DNA-binding response OmpR family regulator